MGRNENHAELSVSFTDGRAVTAGLNDIPRITSMLMTHLCETASRSLNGEGGLSTAITLADSTGGEVTLTTEQAYALATSLLRGVSEVIQAARRSPDPSLN